MRRQNMENNDNRRITRWAMGVLLVISVLFIPAGSFAQDESFETHGIISSISTDRIVIDETIIFVTSDTVIEGVRGEPSSFSGPISLYDLRVGQNILVQGRPSKGGVVATKIDLIPE